MVIGELVFCISAHFSQITHYLSHKMNHASDKEKGKIIFKMIHILQKNNIILNPTIHKIHHEKLDRNFPILNGWSNFLINKIILNVRF